MPAPGAYVEAFPTLVPTLLRLHRPFHRVLRREMKRVLYLSALLRTIRKRSHESNALVLIDEGPVYMLTRLLFLADSALDTEAFRTWWQGAIAEWAAVLDVVVWLDADSRVLVSRIRGRAQPSPIPDTGDAPLLAFLDRYRSCYETVLQRLAAANGPEVVRVDTTLLTVEELARRIQGVMHEVRA